MEKKKRSAVAQVRRQSAQEGNEESCGGQRRVAAALVCPGAPRLTSEDWEMAEG